MHRQRNIYQSRMLDLLRNCLSDGQDGGCKQRGQTATIWLKALLMPRLAIYIDTGLTGPYSATQWRCQCSAQRGCPSHSLCSSPHWQVGSSWFRKKIVSSEQEQRLSQWADFAKNCLPRIECKELPQFREKYRALGRHVCKIREIGGQKNGVQHATAIYPIPRYTRPRYIGLTLYLLCDGVGPTCSWETEPSLVSVVWWSGAYLFLGDWTIPGICCVMEWGLPVPGRLNHPWYLLCDGVGPTCSWETEPSLVSVVWWSGAYLFLGDCEPSLVQ